MRATFAGIEIARRALQAQRYGLDVTGHNIANANTPGYSRQVVRLSPVEPSPFADYGAPSAARVGGGVSVDQVVRVKDAFVQDQLNAQLQSLGYWQARSQILGELERALLEPSDAGIRAAMDGFWQALQELSGNPESMSSRATVRERALILTETLRGTYERLATFRRQLDAEVRADVTDLNALAERVAELNRRIREAEGMGGIPNDLYDERDRLIEGMARLADVRVTERRDGTVAVTIGGVAMVDGTHYRRIVITDGDHGFASLHWEQSGAPVQLRAGALHARLEGRDVTVPELIAELNALAQALIEGVNAVHEKGFGLRDDPGAGPPGRRFFTTLGSQDGEPLDLDEAAARITLAGAILADAANIAASVSGAPGDGENARAIARVFQERLMANGTATLTEYLASVVGGLGVKTQGANRMAEHQDVLVGHLERLRASVSGVSLDEEMTLLIQFQHAYTAASRLVTAIDQVIETLINRTGLVGRA